MVAKLDIGYVEGNRILPFRDSHNLATFHEKEHCPAWPDRLKSPILNWPFFAIFVEERSDRLRLHQRVNSKLGGYDICPFVEEAM